MKKKDKRGTDAGLQGNVDVQSFSLIFGCKPGFGVVSNTKMCEDICNALLEGLNGDMYSEFPLFMESIMSSDANFELAQSTTLRPLRFYYSYNVATRIYGYIFV